MQMDILFPVGRKAFLRLWSAAPTNPFGTHASSFPRTYCSRNSSQLPERNGDDNNGSDQNALFQVGDGDRLMWCSRNLSPGLAHSQYWTHDVRQLGCLISNDLDDGYLMTLRLRNSANLKASSTLFKYLGGKFSMDWDKAWSNFRRQGKKTSKFSPNKYVSWNPRPSNYPPSEEIDPIKRTERSNLMLWTSQTFTLAVAVAIVTLLLIYTLLAPTR